MKPPKCFIHTLCSSLHFHGWRSITIIDDEWCAPPPPLLQSRKKRKHEKPKPKNRKEKKKKEAEITKGVWEFCEWKRKNFIYKYINIYILPGSILSAFYHTTRGRIYRERLHFTPLIWKCTKTTFDLQRYGEMVPHSDQGHFVHWRQWKWKRRRFPWQPLQNVERNLWLRGLLGGVLRLEMNEKERERERERKCVCVWESSGLFDWYRENVLRGIGILDLGRPVKSHFQLSLGLLFLVALADLSHLCCVFPLLSDPFDPSSYFLFFFLLNFIVIIIKWKVETTPHRPTRSLLGVSQCHMHLRSFIKF